MSGNLVPFLAAIREGHQHRCSAPTFADVREAARGRWHEVLPALGIAPEHLRNRPGPCPGCGGTDRFRFDDRDGRGTWICGGAGAVQAGDGFDLLGHVHGWTAGEALREVSRVLGLDRASAPLSRRQVPSAPKAPAPAPRPWQAVCPVPEEALESVAGIVHPTLGRPVRWWAYLTPRGGVWFIVVRFESGTSKDLRPLSYGRTEGADRDGWGWKRPGSLIPWNLPALYARHGAPVAVAEGEKAAGAAGALLPEYVATCGHGGASQAHLTCWRDLAGRDVTILPDDDAASCDTWAPTLATLLAGIGARVRIADPLRADGAPLIGGALEHTGTGDDAADLPATAEGSARLRALVANARPLHEIFPHMTLDAARTWTADQDAERIRRVAA